MNAMTALPAIPVPRIETARLIMRGHELRDFDAYAAFWAGPRATPFGGPFSRRDAWDSFLADAGHWAIRGFGQWIIEDRATGTAAGWTGFVLPDHGQEPELGWTLFDGFEGRGIASHAARAAREYGARQFDIISPISIVPPGNDRSAALAIRLGATLIGTRDDGTRIYRHPEARP